MRRSIIDFVQPNQFFEISYLYRDASNYKCWGTFVVKGSISIHDLRPYLIDQEYFIPQRIGVPALTPEEFSEDDHLFHEIHSTRQCAKAPYAFTADELVERVRSCSRRGWFC